MSGLPVALSGIRAAPARADISAQTAATAGVWAGATVSDPPLAASPMAAPIPRVYRPVRANLYNRAPGGGAGRVYRHVAPGYFSIHDLDDLEPDGEAATFDPPTYPQSERLRLWQATISYSIALNVIETVEDMQMSIKDVVT